MVSTRANQKDLFATPSGTPARARKSAWQHQSLILTRAWLTLSLPLVIWDFGYVLLRPYSMPGGKYHALWTPYALYGTIDYVYGWKAFNDHNGFTSAQGAMNVVETAMYLVYLYLVSGSRAGSSVFAPRSVSGRNGALASLILFAASVMTASKTVLYGLNEYYSGWENVGHNTAWNLITLWILPNVPWIIIPTWISYLQGIEIIDGLTFASDESNAVTKDR